MQSYGNLILYKEGNHIATMTSTWRGVSAWLMIYIYIDSNMNAVPRGFHDGALLICSAWTTSPWWLQNFWIQIGTRPSAIIMLTIYNGTWIISRQHTDHITVIKSRLCFGDFNESTPHWFLCFWWVRLVTEIMLTHWRIYTSVNWVVIGLSHVRCQVIITHTNAYLLSLAAKFSEIFIKYQHFLSTHIWKNVPHFVQASIC